MAEKFPLHPFEIKKDAQGRMIKPEFIDQTLSVPDPVEAAPLNAESESPLEAQDSTPQEPQDLSEVAPPPDEVSQDIPEASKKKFMPKKEVNIRRIREDLERERAEKDLMARELEFYRRAQPSTAPQRQAAPQEDHDHEEDITIGDDDLVEGKHLKKIVLQMQKKLAAANQSSAQYAQNAQQTAIELQLRTQYPDIDQVVTADNIKDLEAAYPEVHATLSANPDLKSKAVAAYTLIKNLGIYNDPTQFDADKERVKKNASKPRPASSSAPTHSSPLAYASTFSGKLTQDMKDSIYREMKKNMSK